MIKICEHESFTEPSGIKLMIAAALFHDAYDHKYVKSGKEVLSIQKKVEKDLMKVGFKQEEIKRILKIIDNISFSHEKKLRKEGKPLYLGDL